MIDGAFEEFLWKIIPYRLKMLFNSILFSETELHAIYHSQANFWVALELMINILAAIAAAILQGSPSSIDFFRDTNLSKQYLILT